MITDQEREVRHLIEDGKGDIGDYLQNLISFKTISPTREDKVEADDYQNLQEYVSGILEQLGFQIETWEVEIEFSAIFIPGTKDKQAEIEEQLRCVAATDPWMRKHPPDIKFNEEWFIGPVVDENEPIVKVGMQALEDLGIEPKLRGFGTLTDAIHLINYAKVPTISFGPSLKTAHMANEYLDIDELLTTTQGLAPAIMRWCDFDLLPVESKKGRWLI